MPTPHLKPLIEGPADGPTLFFVQGWPDDYTLWDEQVAFLRDRYRCVRVDLPNYNGVQERRWGYSHDEIVDGLVECVREFSPYEPVTLVVHDWGAVWGYRLHHRHPELVARIVGLDVAPEMNPTPREALVLVLYQFWLLGAFVAGGRVGDWMTRALARISGAPRQGAAIDSSINYPYLHTWREILAGQARRVLEGYRPTVPLLYVYGAKKPMRLHSERWLEYVKSRPGNAVVALEDTGHWVTRDAKFNALLRDWLDRTPTSASVAAMSRPGNGSGALNG